MEETNTKKIKIYTLPSCHHCHTAKDFLKDNNVDFEEVDLGQNQAAIEEMVKKTGQMGVPVIEGPTGEIIIGFNQEALEKMIEGLK